MQNIETSESKVPNIWAIFLGCPPIRGAKILNLLDSGGWGAGGGGRGVGQVGDEAGEGWAHSTVSCQGTYEQGRGISTCSSYKLQRRVLK